MRVRHSILYVTIAVVTAIALAGCSAGAQTSAAPAASAGNAAAAEATYVQVQSIDGNTITAVVGTMPQGAGGAQQPGASPDQSSGDNSGPKQQESMPEQPSDDNGGSQPQGTPGQQPSDDNKQGGGQPGGGQPGGMGFTAGDETITFTIGDATVITAQSGPEAATTDTKKLTVADIAVGDILAVTLSSDNVAETIMVQQSGMPSEQNSAL